MTLTYILDLDILPLDFHAKIQVCMSVRSARRVRQTDGHTDTLTQTMPKQNIMSETLGVTILLINPFRAAIHQCMNKADHIYLPLLLSLEVQ